MHTLEQAGQKADEKQNQQGQVKSSKTDFQQEIKTKQKKI